jgi:hypothetical protein
MTINANAEVMCMEQITSVAFEVKIGKLLVAHSTKENGY